MADPKVLEAWMEKKGLPEERRRALRYVNDRKEEAVAARARLRPEGDPGKLRSFGQGVPVGLGDLSDFAANSAISLGSKLPGMVGRNISAFEGVPSAGAAAREGLPDKESLSPSSKTARTAGEGVGGALGTLPLTGGGGMAARGAGQLMKQVGGRSLLELLSGGSGAVASDLAAQSDAGIAGQMGAGLAGGLLPGGLKRLAAGPVSAIAGEIPMARSGIARRLARQTLGARVRDRKVAIAALDEEIARPLFGKATTAQALGKRGRGVMGLEKQLARKGGDAGDDLRNAVEDLREASADAADVFGSRQFDIGNEDDAADHFVFLLDKINRKITKAYAKAGDIDGIPTSRVRAAAAKVAQEAGDELASDTPQEQMKLIIKYGDTVNLKRLTRLRTKLLEVQAKARRSGDNNLARTSNEIVDAIESTIDEVAEAGGATEVRALRRAQAIRRVKGERFDVTQRGVKGKRIINEILGGEFDDMGKNFKRFLNGKTPVRDLRQLKLTLGDNPDAWGGIKKLIRDEIFGEDLERIFTFEKGGGVVLGGTHGAARKALRKHKRAFEVVYGEGAYKNADDFLQRVRQLSAGVVGTEAEFAVTGSNMLEGLFDKGRVVAEMAQGNPLRASIAAFKLATGTVPKTMVEAQSLIAEALVDPELARAFLAELPDQAMPKWVSRARTITARAGRTGAFVDGNLGE